MYDKNNVDKKIKNRKTTNNLGNAVIDQDKLAKLMIQLFLRSCGGTREEKRSNQVS